jgi:hypothetical protein
MNFSVQVPLMELSLLLIGDANPSAGHRSVVECS